MPSLEAELTDDNVLSYARAGVELGEYMGVLSQAGYDTVLLPSRGAYPLFKIATLSNMMDMESGRFNVVTIPFTADSEDGSDIATQIRNYWVRVYSAMQSDDREQNLDYQFYKFVLREVIGLPTEEESNARFSNAIKENSPIPSRNNISDFIPYDTVSGKTIYIDTVISGKSCCTIMDALDEHGIDYHAVLMLDKNGSKLKHPYKSKIDTKLGLRQATTINVPRLFTEDQGPSMIGVTSVVFPGLMITAGEYFDKMPAAGFWFEAPTADKPLMVAHNEPISNTEFIMDMMLYVGTILVRDDIGKAVNSHGVDEAKRDFPKMHKHLVNHIKENDLLNPEATEKEYKLGFERFKTKPVSVDATSSHVLEVRFDDGVARKIMQDFARKYMV